MQDEISALLEKHTCLSYYVLFKDPDSDVVFSIKHGNREWIAGELQREIVEIEEEWRAEFYNRHNHGFDL